MKKLKGFSHYILTKYNTQPFDGVMLYDKPDADKWMEKRIKLFEKTKESILNQMSMFNWIISIDKRTPDRFVKQIKTDKRIHIVNCDIRDAFKEIRVNMDWVITTRLDNDDLHLPGSIKAIQDAFKPEEMVIDLRYEQLVGDDRYSSGIEKDRWVRPRPNSPFLSLVESSCDIITAFARPHSKMLNARPGVFASEKTLAYMVIHGDNAANKIVGKKL